MTFEAAGAMATASSIADSHEGGHGVEVREGLLPAEEGLLSELLLEELPAFYDDVDATFPSSLIRAASQQGDDCGYFTLRRTFFVARHGGAPVGFTTAAFKRGGSAKIGPTAVLAPWRRQGVATRLRDAAEAELEVRYEARKLYLTVPANNTPALLFNLGRGFKVEGVLHDQYQSGRAELVLGRFPGRRPWRTDQDPLVLSRSTTGTVTSRIVSDSSAAALESQFRPLLATVFDGIDLAFFVSIIDATSPARQAYSLKGKSLIGGFVDSKLDGICVYTPKRGGAVKIAPIVATRLDVIEAMVCRCVDLGFAEGRSKLYAHVPMPHATVAAAMGRLGFQPEAQLRAPYKPGVDVLVVSKTLQA